MKMTTFGPLLLSADDLQAQIQQAYDNFDGKPQIAVIYPSIYTPIARIVQIIKKTTDIPVIGATSGGAAFTEKGIAFGGFTGAFLGGEDTYIYTRLIKDVNNNKDKVLEVLNDITSLTAKGPGHSIFLLANATAFDGEGLSLLLSRSLPPYWHVLGGFAGDNFRFEQTKVIFDDEELDNSIIFTYINSDTVPGVGVRHGYCPLDGMEEMVITKIENNILHEINHRPALEVYCNILENRGLLKDKKNVTPSLALYSIGVQNSVGEKWKIRSPLGVQGQSLILAGSIPDKSHISIVNTENKDLLASAQEAKEIALKNLEAAKPSAQLVVDCAGRQNRLGQEYVKEVQAFRVSSQCPMLGFASYGEFARYGGELEGFHNTTAVLSIW